MHKTYEIFKMGRKFCFTTLSGKVIKQGTRMEADANVIYYRRVEAA